MLRISLLATTFRYALFAVAVAAPVLWLLHAQISLLPLPGAFSTHMLWHIVLMNGAAPIVAAVSVTRTSIPALCSQKRVLLTATILQILVLIAWHVPAIYLVTMSDPSVALMMQLTLFGVAWFFWRTVFQQDRQYFWRALAALLITAKLYCLMAALLVFSPRTLYPANSISGALGVELADQQLAAVMMVVACPLSYIVIATVMTARWLDALRRQYDVAPSSFNRGVDR